MRRQGSGKKKHKRGNVPALLLLDLISDFRFPDGARIARAALPVARRIARLKARAVAAGVPVIYVNDVAGQWHSQRDQFVEHCLSDRSHGRELVSMVMPQKDDYFIFKPRHSGFYATPLNVLLEQLGSRELILAGLTSHQCVLFTAVDAHIRGYRLIIPRDCVAAPTQAETTHAMFVYATALDARTPLSRSLRLPHPASRA